MSATSPTADFADVAIIGGGVVGSSIAYHLSASTGFKGRIAVIERDPSYAAASSSLSTSAIRQQFGTRPNILMSAYGIDFLRNVPTLLATADHPAEIALREPGYLILGKPEHVPAFEAKLATQRACGLPTERLDPADIRDRHPWLQTGDLGIATYGPDGEGWFDGPGLLAAFRRKARAAGVEYIADTVIGIERDRPGHIAALHLARAGRLTCGTVVNAAGAWSGAVASLAGLEVPVVPRKRCVFVFDSPERIPNAPFVFDTSGVFLRPEGHLYLCGITPPAENADDDYSLEIDHHLFEERIWPALAHRIPGFARLRLLRAWAGLYDYNLFDHSALIGPHPDLPNFILACGFSGHGMMHAPATGAAVSDIILHGQSRSLDVSAFAFERIAADEPITEHVY